MYVIFPSENETGTLSNLAADFETARYYTIASIIEGTLADTKIKMGYPALPEARNWGGILARLKVDVVVAGKISQETASSVSSAGIRLIRGAKGLVGDLIDWIADVGLDEFEEKVASLSKQPAPSTKAEPGQKMEPIINKAAAQPVPVTEGTKPPAQGKSG